MLDKTFQWVILVSQLAFWARMGDAFLQPPCTTTRSVTQALIFPGGRSHRTQSNSNDSLLRRHSVSENNKQQMDLSDTNNLKKILQEYLAKREEVNADEIARQQVGKVIGGTKGNKILDYVSGAPNKESVVDTPPNVFDYDELTKYGYGYLVTPIMDAGGRFAMYRLLGLDEPAIVSKPKPTNGPEFNIDRTGESDPKTYKGLGFRNIDDDAQAQALDRLMREGNAKKDLSVPEFEKPFAYVKGKSSRQDLEVALKRIDDLQEEQNRAARWARKVRLESLVKDEYENLNLNLVQRINSVVTGVLVALSFGKSTPTFFQSTIHMDGGDDLVSLLQNLQVPAFALLSASVGSGILCAVSAPEKRRNGFTWLLKGLLGGPLVIRELKDLPSLITYAEQLEIKQGD